MSLTVESRRPARSRRRSQHDSSTPGLRLSPRLEYLVLAIVAYVPQLWARPGLADSDIKSYLYLDPGRWLRQSASMWDPNVGLGTVTHEQIGYLWPLGPYYWAVHALGIPLWVGQRLWVGSLLFGAGAGVLFLCRTLGLDGPGRPVAAFAYMVAPYFLQDVGRISSLLLPWSGLGWLLAFVARGTRRGGWRDPALFALVWVTISGNNASGPIYAAFAPALWLLWAVFVARQVRLGAAWATTWRTALLTGGVSLWWAWSLLVEGRYGVNILGYTETVAAVAKTSTANEILRGLGYWFFYGADSLGPWAAPLTGFTQNLWLVGISFAVPLLAVVSFVSVRWRHRAYFAALLLAGVVLAVGSHPYTGPSVVGSIIKSFMTKTTAGLALRSSDRATPMVLLALVMMLGAGITALTRRLRPAGITACVAAIALIAAANPAAWNGSTVLDRYTFPTPLPDSVQQATSALNALHPGTRVLAIPSNNGAVYTFGDTVDPIWPGILDRPFVTGQQVPLGSLPTYDVLYGLNTPMQSGVANPAALAPMARLLDAGDILVQNNIAYWLYDRPSPQQFVPSLGLPQAGLGKVADFGTPAPNLSNPPQVNEAILAGDPAAPWPAPLQVMSVQSPRPIVRSEPTSGAVVVAGDGVGLDAAAGLGLLGTTAPVLYAGTLDTDHQALEQALAGGATLVLTDSNRKETFAWNLDAENAGPTLPASAPAPGDTLDIFPNAPDSAQSTADYPGIYSVSAVPDTADHPAINAIDGNDATSWQTNLASAPAGRVWQVTLQQPVTTDHITVLQAPPGDYQHQQWITEASVSLDGGQPFGITLGPASHQAPGQRIDFPRASFSSLSITISSTNLSSASLKVKQDASPVGLAEVGIAGVTARQVVSMPSDLLAAAGQASQSHRLVVLMTRWRDSAVAPQADPESVLDRSFVLPGRRSFSMVGTATISPQAADPTIDTVTGRSGGSGGIVAYSSTRLPGDVAATASAALDGNPSTAWMPALGTPSQIGAWLQVNLPRAVTVDHLDLQLVADSYHSLPSALRVQACDTLGADGRCPTGSVQADVRVPAVQEGPRGSVRSDPVSFPAVTGRYLTFTVTGAALRTYKHSLSDPIAVAELGIPGVQAAAPAPALSASCRDDLLQVDGKPLWVSLGGSTQGALAGERVTLQPCGPDAGGVTLGPGSHVVTSTPGVTTGIDVDQLALDSAPGGDAMAGDSPLGLAAPPAPGPAPTVHLTSSGTTSAVAHITGVTAGRPFWLVLGQSVNKGWTATVAGSAQALGRSTLVDGFANGWLVHPTTSGSMTVRLRWAPQGGQDLALLGSALAVTACLAIVLATRRRRWAGEDGEEPGLEQPFGRADRPPMWMAAVAGVSCGLGSALLVPPAAAFFTAMGVGVLVVVALQLPRARGLLGVSAVGLVAAAVLYILVHQAASHFGANGSWPSEFETASVLVWVAVVLVASDAVVERVRRRR